MLIVVAHFRTAPDAGDFVAMVLARHATASRAEPGCLQFEASRSIDDPDSVILHEAYASEDALQAHRDSPHSPHFAENAGHAIVPLLFKRDWGRYQPHDYQRGTATLP